jgi:hypothetical protein
MESLWCCGSIILSCGDFCRKMSLKKKIKAKKRSALLCKDTLSKEMLLSLIANIVAYMSVVTAAVH